MDQQQRQDLHRALDKAIDCQAWINDQWEPFMKAEDKVHFTALINFIASQAVQHVPNLGNWKVIWSKCPQRAFEVNED